MIDKLLRRAAARNVADAEPLDGEPAGAHAGGHRIADAARGVVILDRDDPLRVARASQQRARVDRLQRIEIDHTDADPDLLQLIVRLERFEYRDAAADDRRRVVRAFTQDLQPPDGELLVGTVDD